jgi:hypothetical protein
MAQDNLPPSYDAIATAYQTSADQVPELIASTSPPRDGPTTQSQLSQILTQLQNITTALQTITAEQQAHNSRLASIEARLTANESRTLNIRARERNAASTRSDVNAPLEPLYDVQIGGVIPNCPDTEAAIARLTRSDAMRILSALECDVEGEPPMSFLRECVRQELISISKGSHR